MRPSDRKRRTSRLVRRQLKILNDVTTAVRCVVFVHTEFSKRGHAHRIIGKAFGKANIIDFGKAKNKMQASIVPRDREASLRQCFLERREEDIAHVAGVGAQAIHMPLEFSALHEAREGKLVNCRNRA